MDFEMTRPTIAKFNMRQKSQKYLPFALILTLSLPAFESQAEEKTLLKLTPSKEKAHYQPSFHPSFTVEKTNHVFLSTKALIINDFLKPLGKHHLAKKIATDFNFSYALHVDQLKPLASINEKRLEVYFKPSEEVIDWLESDTTSSNLKSLIHKVAILTPKKATSDQFFSFDLTKFENLSSILKRSQAIAKVYLETPKEVLGLDTQAILKLVSFETKDLPPLPDSYALNPEPIVEFEMASNQLNLCLEKQKILANKEIGVSKDDKPKLTKDSSLSKYSLSFSHAIEEIEGVELLPSDDEKLIAKESSITPKKESFDLPSIDSSLNSDLKLDKVKTSSTYALEIQEEKILKSHAHLVEKAKIDGNIEIDLPKLPVEKKIASNDLENPLDRSFSFPTIEEGKVAKIDEQSTNFKLNLPTISQEAALDIANYTQNLIGLEKSLVEHPKLSPTFIDENHELVINKIMTKDSEGDFFEFIHSFEKNNHVCIAEESSKLKSDLAIQDHLMNLASLQFDSTSLVKIENVVIALNTQRPFDKVKLALDFYPSANTVQFVSSPLTNIEIDPSYLLVTNFAETKPSFAEKVGFQKTTICQNVIKDLPKLLGEATSFVDLLAKNENYFDPTQVITIDNAPSEGLDSSYRGILKRKAYDYLSLMPSLHDLNTYVLSADFRHEAEVIAAPDGESYYFSVQLMPYYPEDLRKIHQNVYFVLDQSRTISEERFEAFKKGILRSIPYLSQESSFNIIVLNKHNDVLNLTNLSNDKEALELARSFLDKISYSFTVSPQEYSHVIPFIEEKFKVNPDDLNTIILLSDGAAYKNFHIYRDKISEVCLRNKNKFQLYTVAASQDNYLNALDMVAFHNYGQLLYSKTNAALPRQLAILVKNLRNPIANNLHLSTIRNENDQIVFFPPSGQLPALYADKPLTIYGKTNCLQNFDLMIQGKADDEWINISQSINLRQAKRGDRELLRNVQLMEKKLRYFQETDTVNET